VATSFACERDAKLQEPMNHAPFVLRPLLTLTFLAILPCLSGCFGFGTLFTDTNVVENPVISQKKGRLWFKTDKPRERPILASEVLDYWGEPDEIIKHDSTEVWIYQFGLRWNGLGVALIIPIPLIVPVGHEELSLLIDEDRHLVSVKIEGQQDNGFLCMFLAHPGCYVSSEWMCKFLPLCYHFDRKPFSKQFREYRPDNLIPGQI
jgi:hypothetical protein